MRTEVKSNVQTPFSQDLTYVQSNDLLADSRNIIETARRVAYKAVDVTLVQRNWLLGRRIADEHLEDKGHAAYGKQVIQTLASQLTDEYGGGFDFSSLYKYLKFYRLFPILDSLRPKFGNLLSWTHYRILLQVEDLTAREWYLNEAGEQTWSVRTLQIMQCGPGECQMKEHWRVD